MAKGAIIDMGHLSPEARDWLDGQMTRTGRHVIARAGLLAAQSNDDIVLPSHIEIAWNEIVHTRSSKKRLGIAIVVSALVGGVAQSILVGMGKSFGEYALHFFQ